MDEKTYKQLIKKNFSAQDINQIIKATEAGYDICNPDIWMPSERLREFRNYLMENLKPVFNHDQLREIQIGFLKKIDVPQYAYHTYTPKEMALMRKMLEDGKDIAILKENSENEYEMQTIYNALKIGLEDSDIKKYDCKQLEYITKCLKSKKIDVRPLLDKGYNEQQISAIYRYKSKGLDIEPLITPLFSHDKIDVLSKCLAAYKFGIQKNNISDEDFNKIFNPNFNMEQLDFIESSLRYGFYSPEFVEVSYPASKMSLIHAMRGKKCSDKNIELIKNSNFSYNRYYSILQYLSKNSFDTILVDPLIDDELFSSLKPFYNIKIFEKLAKDKFDSSQITSILQAEYKGFFLAEYAKPTDSINKLSEKVKLLKFCKSRNINYLEEKYILENVPFDKLDTYILCKKLNVDFKKAENLTSSKIKTVATYKDDGIDLLKYNLEKMHPVKINALGTALRKRLPIENILQNDDNSKFHIILSLENFNASNERKIDIDEILNLDTDAKTLGQLISKLMSNNLEENINGYKEIEKIPKRIKEEKTVQKSLFYEEHPDFY